MSFWDLSDGSQAKSETEYEAPSGGGVIPDDTDLLGYVDEIKWDEKDGARFITARWRVAKPAALKNRVVFQKLWVLGNNPQTKDAEKRKKQGDAAKRMLAAIDANAGGQLLTINGIPSDSELQSALMNKMMVIKVKVWEMTGTDGKAMQGNWVCAVSPPSKTVSEDVKAAPAAPKPQAQVPSGGGYGGGSVDDEIPFAPEWRI